MRQCTPQPAKSAPFFSSASGSRWRCAAFLTVCHLFCCVRFVRAVCQRQRNADVPQRQGFFFFFCQISHVLAHSWDCVWEAELWGGAVQASRSQQSRCTLVLVPQSANFVPNFAMQFQNWCQNFPAPNVAIPNIARSYPPPPPRYLRFHHPPLKEGMVLVGCDGIG